MADDLIPDDIKGFISQHIDSIVQLKALLLLLHANRELEWNADAVAKRLYIKAEKALPWLERLSNDGFLVSNSKSPPFYQYQPATLDRTRAEGRLTGRSIG